MFFKRAFGFIEQEYDYSRKKIIGMYNDETFKINGIGIGEWKTYSIDDLGDIKLDHLGQKTPKIVVGRVETLHLNHPNSVFQVASQFNGLEGVNWNMGPKDGITNYVHDKTQGPAASMMCPAALAYRNFILSDKNKQIKLLPSSIPVKNGYIKLKTNPESLPTDFDVKVGVHLDADVFDKDKCELVGRVAQVFCSAPCISCHKWETDDWECFTRYLLVDQYKLTLLSALKISRIYRLE